MLAGKSFIYAFLAGVVGTPSQRTGAGREREVNTMDPRHGAPLRGNSGPLDCTEMGEAGDHNTATAAEAEMGGGADGRNQAANKFWKSDCLNKDRRLHADP